MWNAARLFCPSFDPVAGVAERNPLAESYKQHLLSFCPVMRQYKLFHTADHLEQWALGTLDRQPLLDVSECFGQIAHHIKSLPHVIW